MRISDYSDVADAEPLARQIELINETTAFRIGQYVVLVAHQVEGTTITIISLSEEENTDDSDPAKDVDKEGKQEGLSKEALTAMMKHFGKGGSGGVWTLTNETSTVGNLIDLGLANTALVAPGDLSDGIAVLAEAPTPSKP